MSAYPPFRPKRAREALATVYWHLDLPMPEVVVAPDLLGGYEAARADAAGVAQEACRCVVSDSLWGEQPVSAVYGTIWSLCWEDTLHINRERLTQTLGGTRVTERQKWALFSQAQFVGQSKDFAGGYSRAKTYATNSYASLFSPQVFPRIEYQEISLAFRRAHEYGLLWYFPLETAVILVPAPRILTDPDNRLHSISEPAVAWRKGATWHFLHGVWFGKALWKQITGNDLTASQVLGIKNIEQRRAALQVYGVSRIIKHAGRMLEEYQGYTLYRVENIFPITAYFLRYTCPSTGREYVSGIHPEIGERRSVVDALKWKFQLMGVRDGKLFTQES
jgi:hypothetical protein